MRFFRNRCLRLRRHGEEHRRRREAKTGLAEVLARRLSTTAKLGKNVVLGVTSNTTFFCNFAVIMRRSPCTGRKGGRQVKGNNKSLSI